MSPSVPLLDRLRYELTHLWGFATGYRVVNIGCAPIEAQASPALRWADSQGWSLTVYAQLWSELAALRPSPAGTPRVLEVGSGQGDGLRHLARAHDGDWVGVDLSLVATLLTRLRGNRARWAANQALPFADASFDVAFGVEAVLVFRDGDVALRELRRVLVRGGLLGLAEFSDLTITEAEAQATARAGAVGLRCVGFTDHSEAARRSILLGEPLRAAANRRIPPPLRRSFAEMMSLEGTERHRRWRAGGYCYWSAVFEAV